MKNYSEKILSLEAKVLKGAGIDFKDGLFILDYPEEGIFELLASANRIRIEFKKNEVRLCSIINAKSGLCSEDCAFCAQSAHYDTGIKTYPMVHAETIIKEAKAALKNGAREFSVVTSGKGIKSAQDIERLIEAIRKIHEETPLESCTSPGILDDETLIALKDAGLHSFHHNLETSRSFFPNICSTHDYEDDVKVVRKAMDMGFHVCCGGIFGIGEEDIHRVELAHTLAELDVDSVPVNFLNPRPGTPLMDSDNLTPLKCLKIIALLRFMLPQKDIIVCGGREVNLKDMQPLIFAAGANGMMIGNYLTTNGRNVEDDLSMLRHLGLRSKGF